MKKFLTLLAAVTFAATAVLAEAATPKAAEEPSATVLSTDAPAPRAKKVAKTVKGKKKHAAVAKKHAKKKHAKARHRKVRHTHR